MIQKAGPNNEEETIVAELLTDADLFWIETAQKSTAAGVDALEEGAKQIITTASLLQGIYFAAVSFSDIKKTINYLSPWSLIFLFLLLLPAVIWAISCIFALKVFSPRKYDTNFNSPELCKRCFINMVQEKYINFRKAQWILVLGFIPFIFGLFVYLAFVPVPVTKP
jgi:hypothetical protein